MEIKATELDLVFSMSEIETLIMAHIKHLNEFKHSNISMECSEWQGNAFVVSISLKD